MNSMFRFLRLKKAYDERDGADITLLDSDPSYTNLRAGTQRFGVEWACRVSKRQQHRLAQESN
jgi:hypothetical protein